MKSKYNIVIIGCGTAAGFFLSFLNSRVGKEKPDVLVLEKSPKIFRKIRVSGNGRCNYSNLEMGEEQYYSFSAAKDWSQKAFRAARSLNLQGFFYKQGIPSSADEYKRLFPYTNSAATIAEFFENTLKGFPAELQLNSEATQVKPDKANGKYEVLWTDAASKSKLSAFADAVVFASGGSAYPQYGTDGSVFKLLQGLGHTVMPQTPGIVPLETPHREFRELDGMKIETEISFKDFKRTGELLFTDYGISGPNVLYASNTISMELEQGPVTIHVSFLPKNELTYEFFHSAWQASGTKTFTDVFRGALQVRFIEAFLKYASSLGKQFQGKLNEKQLKEAFSLLTRCPMQVTKARSFKDAQVSLGGVHCREVNPETFESKLHKRIFILGEMLDYTGGCGGYNIHWAAATALKAVSSI
ncbi:MAG: aminoacetone oxidase family FAD-binding enzyme [Elusimicrobiota bacterium]